MFLLLTLACSSRWSDRGGDPNLADDSGDTSTISPNDTGDTGDTGPQVTPCDPPPGAGTVPTLADCSYEPGPSGTPFSATVEWSMTQALVDPASGASLPAYSFASESSLVGVFQAPSVGQCTDDNGDGLVNASDTPDIAVLMGDEFDETSADAERSVLRLISGDGGQVHDSALWSEWKGQQVAPYIFSGVAMGDIDADGLTEIVVLMMDEDGRTGATDSSCMPGVFEVSLDGELSLESLSDDRVWCHSHAPSLADMNGDGHVEVLLGDAIYDGRDLALLWEGGQGAGWYNAWVVGAEGYWNSGYHSFAYDLDGDGVNMELVAGNTVYDNQGDVYCTLGTSSGAALDGYPAVADLVGNDGTPEIVLSGNQYVTLFRGTPDSHGVCEQLSQITNDPYVDSSITLPEHPEDCDTDRNSFGGQPTIADFDGDGRAEVGVSGACWYTVFDVSGGSLSRYAMAPTRDWSSASTGATVFDFNGDGQAEVVFSDENALYVWQIDSSAGLHPTERFVTVLEDTNHKSWTIHEYPLVVDVDGDGKAEIVAVNGPRPEYMEPYGIYVLGADDDDWVSARSSWNQHAYYVSNIDDDGTIGVASPNYAPYWSEDLNSFRQQAPGSFGAKAAPNLILEASACQAECGDAVNVDVQVANEGAYITVSGGVLLSLYGVIGATQTLVDTYTIPTDIAPGEQTSGIRFQVSGWAGYDSLLLVVDDPERAGVSGWGVAKECDEGDNSAQLELAGFCE